MTWKVERGRKQKKRGSQSGGLRRHERGGGERKQGCERLTAEIPNSTCPFSTLSKAP